MGLLHQWLAIRGYFYEMNKVIAKLKLGLDFSSSVVDETGFGGLGNLANGHPSYSVSATGYSYP